MGVAPAAPRLLGSDSTLHLLRRATYGLTPSLVARGRSLGARAWLEEQLAPSTIADTTADAMLTHFPRLKWSIKTVWDAENRPDTDPLRLDNFSWDVMMDLLHSTIGRALWSKRQLFEVMVDFWSNHLNVTCPGDGWDNRHLYDRDVIRKHTFGSYRDMLLASAKHPAMLQYLNQAESNKYAPNENYARELLELHSVGVDGGYEEADIYAAARLLTGLTTWNPNPPYSDDNPSWTRQDFTFNASIHDATAGKVLGYSWAAHNAGQGLTYIDAYITLPGEAPQDRGADRLQARAAVRRRRAAGLAGLEARRRLPGEQHRDRPRAASAVHLPGVPLLLGDEGAAPLRGPDRRPACDRRAAEHEAGLPRRRRQLLPRS